MLLRDHSESDQVFTVNALRVIAKRSQDNGNAAPTFFARILGFDSLDIEVSAVATSGLSACMLALEPSDNKAFDVGNRDYLVNGCSVHRAPAPTSR